MTALLLYLTLGVAALIVAVLVVYLVAIVHALASAKRSLEQLAQGLIAVRDHTRPLPEHMNAINGGLTTLLQGLVAVNGDLAAVVQIAQRK